MTDQKVEEAGTATANAGQDSEIVYEKEGGAA